MKITHRAKRNRELSEGDKDSDPPPNKKTRKDKGKAPGTLVLAFSTLCFPCSS